MSNSIKTSKYFIFAAALVLLMALGTVAMAQEKSAKADVPFRMPPVPVNPIVNVNAIEISGGTVDLDSETRESSYRYRFLGRTTGSLPGSLTLFMNSSSAIPVPGDVSEFKIGAWTLPVYMTVPEDSGYAGSLYGTVATGKMKWDNDALTADLYLVLNVDGGTQTWEGVQGYATFVGTLTIDKDHGKTTLTGQMEFIIK